MSNFFGSPFTPEKMRARPEIRKFSGGGIAGAVSLAVPPVRLCVES
jgi:hypothetical protein